MSPANHVQLLRDISFFEGVDDRRLAQLAQMCRAVTFPARATMFEEFDRAKDVYFILEGNVSLAVCDANGCRQISVVGKGDLLGWSPLIGRTRLFDTARTVTPMKALSFDADDLLEFCRKNTDFGFEFMRRAAAVLGERLSATHRQLLEVSGLHLPEFALESD
jgi:CRP-like cAMP-binding protein